MEETDGPLLLFNEVMQMDPIANNVVRRLMESAGLITCGSNPYTYLSFSK